MGFTTYKKHSILYISKNRNDNDLLRFEGKVQVLGRNMRKPAYILKDDGASDYFIDRAKAEELIREGARTRDAGWMEVRVARNNTMHEGLQKRQLVQVDLRIQGYRMKEWFTVMNLDDYDIILGKA